MEVHAPHEPIRSWKDFFLHLTTITIGLLIALSLEGMVEWMHHRHLVNEAHENLQEEIRENRQTLDQDRVYIQADLERIDKIMAMLRQLRENPKMHADASIRMSWASVNDSAWKTARDTGALSLMSYKKVQMLSDVYSTQDVAMNMAIEALNNQTRASAPLLIEGKGDGPTAAQVGEALHGCAETKIRLLNLQQVLAELGANYDDALKKF
jgi:hypothetical protein